MNINEYINILNWDLPMATRTLVMKGGSSISACTAIVEFKVIAKGGG